MIWRLRAGRSTNKDKTSSPSPPSPRGEGGNLISYNGLAPLPRERGWGEAKKK